MPSPSVHLEERQPSGLAEPLVAASLREIARRRWTRRRHADAPSEAPASRRAADLTPSSRSVPATATPGVGPVILRAESQSPQRRGVDPTRDAPGLGELNCVHGDIMLREQWRGHGAGFTEIPAGAEARRYLPVANLPPVSGSVRRNIADGTTPSRRRHGP